MKKIGRQNNYPPELRLLRLELRLELRLLLLLRPPPPPPFEAANRTQQTASSPKTSRPLGIDLEAYFALQYRIQGYSLKICHGRHGTGSAIFSKGPVIESCRHVTALPMPSEPKRNMARDRLHLASMTPFDHARSIDRCWRPSMYTAVGVRVHAGHTSRLNARANSRAPHVRPPQPFFTSEP
jgi:hypothetical protein